jgi:glucosamine-phosphate N-acetyltransferase
MARKPRAKIRIRSARRGDASRGILESLSNLTDMEGLARAKAERLIIAMTSNKKYKLFVAVTKDDDVVGTIALFIEQKLIHNGGKVGHIEDLAVRKEHVGKGVGSALLKTAVAYAEKQSCYKAILDCKESNVPFYEKYGFKRHGAEMRVDFAHRRA